MMYQLILSVILLFGTASAYAALPALPQVYVDTSMPTTSVTKTVCASGCDYTNDKLQQAIDDAQLGTTITLQPGTIYTPLNDAGFILKNKTSGSGWIIIKSATTDSALPPPGTRLTPAYASVMPTITRPPLGNYAMSCEATAHHYRIIGVQFMNPGNVDTAIVGSAFVACNSPLETSLALQSHHILFDRVYIHGPSAGGSIGVKIGIAFGGQHEGVIDSTIEDLTYSSDAQTIWSASGAGPFVIKNNALSSSGENIMFGGSDTLVTNLVPSDIEIRNNYIYKPLKWRDDPAYKGANPILTKNLLEHKNAQRVLIDGNVFENNWPSAQPGYALTFSPRQAASTSNQPWTVVQDITVTNNKFIGTANGIALSGMDPGITASGEPPTSLGGRYLIKNNLFIKHGGYSGTGIMFQLMNGAFDVTISHNTVASPVTVSQGITLNFAGGSPATMPGFVLQDNLFLAKNYPFVAGTGACYASSLGTVLTGYTWTNNVFAGPWSTPDGCASSYAPQSNGNAYPAGESSIGYVNPSGEDYSLAAGSPHKNAASDGTDIGVNWPALMAALGTPTTTTATTTPTTTTSTYTLSVTKTGTGTGTVSGAGTYSSGTGVTLSATPASGATFAGWSGGGCSTANPCNVTVNGNMSVTATFNTSTTTTTPTATSYTLTVSVSGKGSVTGAGTYPAGTNVTLMAIPGSGFRFIGFSGGGCSANPCSVTVNGNMSVAATFKK